MQEQIKYLILIICFATSIGCHAQTLFKVLSITEIENYYYLRILDTNLLLESSMIQLVIPIEYENEYREPGFEISNGVMLNLILEELDKNPLETHFRGVSRQHNRLYIDEVLYYDLDRPFYSSPCFRGLYYLKGCTEKYKN